VNGDWVGWPAGGRMGAVLVSGVRLLAAVVIAAILCLAVGVPVLTMRLVVPFHVVGPLALVTGALAAALGAAWIGNAFAHDRSRLLMVVAVAEALAVVPAAVMIAGYLWPGARHGLFMAPLIQTAAVSAVIIAVGAGLAALLLRAPRGRLGWDGVLALLASVAGLVLGLLVGWAGLLPGPPGVGIQTVGYEDVVRVGVALAVAGALMAGLQFLRSSRDVS
jgi:hypothetical protein